MRQNTRRKKQLKAKRTLRFSEFIRNALSVGFLTGIAVIFCKTMLLCGVLPDALSGLLPEEARKEPVVTAFDGGVRSPGGTDSPLPESVSDALPQARETLGGAVREISYLPASRDSDSHTSGRLQVPDEEETARILAGLSAHSNDIAQICARQNEYPKELLTALALNQEMTEFVKGYLTADGTATGGVSDEEMAAAFPLFIQWDPRWGYVPYGSGPIGVTGCGPTCLSMVIFSLTRDESATPDALAALSMEKGYYMKGAGTVWQFMTDAASWYGLSARELGLDEAALRQYLDQGCPVICAMRPGDFTATGHFIVVYAYDENGYRVNDPNSRERSGRYWSFDTLKGQIRNLWGYSRA